MKSRLPPPRARISGIAASVVISTVRRFRLMARSKVLMSMPSTAAGPGCPTWFQTKSRPLKRLTVSHTMRRESSSFDRSPTIPWAVPPTAVISPTTRWTPGASTSTTATCAPSRAKRKAPARPIPEAAAVTIPIFPARRIDHPPGGNLGRILDCPDSRWRTGDPGRARPRPRRPNAAQRWVLTASRAK